MPIFGDDCPYAPKVTYYPSGKIYVALYQYPYNDRHWAISGDPNDFNTKYMIKLLGPIPYGPKAPHTIPIMAAYEFAKNHGFDMEDTSSWQVESYEHNFVRTEQCNKCFYLKFFKNNENKAWNS